ncbi:MULTISPECIES: hypothetical protein [unclassified Yoonia]|nr:MULTISPECIES: hypothetical protein [unclassified Yoonia]
MGEQQLGAILHRIAGRMGDNQHLGAGADQTIARMIRNLVMHRVTE